MQHSHKMQTRISALIRSFASLIFFLLLLLYLLSSSPLSPYYSQMGTFSSLDSSCVTTEANVYDWTLSEQHYHFDMIASTIKQEKKKSEFCSNKWAHMSTNALDSMYFVHRNYKIKSIVLLWMALPCVPYLLDNSFCSAYYWIVEKSHSWSRNPMLHSSTLIHISWKTSAKTARWTETAKKEEWKKRQWP